MTFRPELLARRIGIGLFSGAFLLYALSGSPYPVPGESAWLITNHSGLNGFMPLSNPLWGELVKAIAWIPAGPLALRLNLFSALCGAGAVWMLYKVLRRLPVHEDIYSVSPHFHTILGLAGALFLMVAPPLWHGSNRTHYESFELLLFLASMLALLHYFHRPSLRPLCLSAFLYGLAMVESPLFILWGPAVAAAMIGSMWWHSDLRPKTLAAAALSVLLALSANLVVTTQYVLHPVYEWRGLAHPLQVLRMLWLDEMKYLLKDLSWQGWCAMVLLCLLPFLLSLLNMAVSPYRRSKTSFHALPGVLTCLTLAFLFNLPIAPWILPVTQKFRVIPPALVAAFFGLTVGFWFYRLKRAEWGRHPDTEGQGAEWAMVLLLFLIILPAGWLNWRRVRTDAARLNHFIVSEMLDALGPRRWLVTDGLFDPSLQILAADRRQPLTLINVRLTDRPEYRKYLSAQFDRPRFQSLAQYSPRGLLREWALTETAFPETVASQDPKFLTGSTGHTTVPIRGICVGLPTASLDVARLFREEETFWARLVFLLDRVPPAFDSYERKELETVRQQFSKAAVEFGVLMETQGRPPFAEASYRAARRIDPRNLNAVINLLERRRAAGADSREERALLLDAQRLAASRPAPMSLPALGAVFGPLASGAAEKSYRSLWESSARQEARAQYAATLAQIDELRRNGQLKEAIARCRELLKVRASATAWNLLGTMAFAEKDFSTFHKCLAEMRRRNATWAPLIFLEGKLAFQRNDWVTAERYFETVHALAPDEIANLEFLIRVKLLQRNTGGPLLAYLDQLLALDPQNPLANRTLGVMHFQRDEYGLAESDLRRSVDALPDAGILGNLAWILHAQDADREALAFAQRSVDLDPSSATNWDTLGVVLLKLGRLQEAEPALLKARSLNPTVSYFQLHYLQLLALTGRRDQAAALAARLQQDGMVFEPAQQAALAKLLAPGR